jgi:anaerobic magnesium-protoporphyrin IX monomethyl ester cyclase
MRIVLADLKADDGFVSKDTVAGGYGSRLRPFSRVTTVICKLKRRFHDLNSIHLAYLAAIASRAGHEVVPSTGELVEADVALVLSSLVDYRREVAWAEKMRARGVRVGFIGLAASKMPELFKPAADFIVNGEPEQAMNRLVAGEILEGIVESPAVPDLDVLPFPRWDLLAAQRRRFTVPFAGRPIGGAFALLASRGCPEFCTYCPHRILAGYRSRSVGNILDEMSHLVASYPRPYVVFRDPLFTESRERVLGLCEGIQNRGLDLTFECETRLDRLDPELLTIMHAAGLRAISFGVEAMSPAILKRVGRRPIPEAHQRLIVDHCRKLGIVTAAFYVLGFLEDDWDSVSATIEYAVDLGSTVAQFKILTPYPGTPLWKKMAPLVTETDWERFDGFTPNFNHPNLTRAQLQYLLGAAYTRFYMRPSYLANYLRISAPRVREMVARLDARVSRLHARRESEEMSRAVSC